MEGGIFEGEGRGGGEVARLLGVWREVEQPLQKGGRGRRKEQQFGASCWCSVNDVGRRP